VKKNKIIPVNSPIITNLDALEVYKTVKSGWISSLGNKIIDFEEKFAKLTNRKFAATVANGTAALEIAIKTLNLKPNFEVIIPTFNIISAALAVVKNNLKPVLVDSDLNTWNMCLKDFEKKITKKTRAIIVTHTYGFPCNIDQIIKICKKNKIIIIEDAAEMIGQTYKGKPCGSFGEISIFSFYANKHITTGEGGIILTNNKKLYEKACSLRNLAFGKKNRFNHDDIGWNYRFTNMQAALGLSQLKRLSKIIRTKRIIGHQYYNLLKTNKFISIQPPTLNNESNIYWIFGILIKKNSKFKKETVIKKLLNKGIQCRDFFWPMHKQKIFKNIIKFKNKKFPIADLLSKNGFYIPTGMNITNKEIKYISTSINKIFR
jgi:perosamine synthetase